MGSRFVPGSPAEQPAPADTPVGLDPRTHLLRVQAENTALERELVRCQQQLSLVLDVSGRLAEAHDPELLQRDFLARYAVLMKADALFVVRGGCCMQVGPTLTGQTAPVTADQVRARLAPQIEEVRQHRRAVTMTLGAERDGARALLGALRRADPEIAVVVALRAQKRPAFDAGDLVAAEGMLAYGTRILDGALTVQHLQRTALETVCTLVNAIDAKDNYTSSHSERVGGLARVTGQALGLSKARLQVLEWAGLLHDVGKIGVPEQVLNKPGNLDREEFELMQRHPRVGFEMLRPVAQLAPMLDAVLYHHENHDGSGYPQRLGGRDIPVDAQIVHVVDIFDALTTDRPYRQGYDYLLALEMLAEGAGRVTEPSVTRLFIKTLRRLMAEKPGDFGAWLAQAIECRGDLLVAAQVEHD